MDEIEASVRFNWLRIIQMRNNIICIVDDWKSITSIVRGMVDDPIVLSYFEVSMETTRCVALVNEYA